MSKDASINSVKLPSPRYVCPIESSTRSPANTSPIQGWDPSFARYSLRLESTSIDPCPTATFTFTVTELMTNFGGVLHGGCAATIIDMLTTVPLGAISRPGFYTSLGVSRSLNVTYFRALRKGEDARRGV
ncbi:hypothetical protein P170DRAFT_288245 [Aspergillus steynii IBT 23096]|uniref:Thioesterase domain-containing protein n=1 Tax=Aspergillus steynii IBT 23096 TaxID=1392250 RepID=A0A2I2FV82_9EURO|nr:uncharacterized protein P170DRAFT_288245 [Aspergillus steynii IBT 23096]PLB44550.1 hypothetical protein P170DRAFT_288245 [Aspergillus steynii IBT 23096]